ncbi:DUF2190 family protein [Paracoccus litorisediminis]|uniref:DUF2190 family protein n=1 Tax=Paracoccus litorisediminis TaxID=2006130 RepID=A0A844HUY0_9RHOB|nr:DUF2190 family protein [Paracoccus litorisediminis]MTH62105.1 DUF2190 family protein [Paracoccus litorisediminis]
MKNFLAHGNALTVTNSTGAAVASGAGVLLGKMFGIAAGPIAAGAEGVINLEGVYELPKAASQAWTVGALVYWDNAAKVCTTVVSTNTLIGVAIGAVAGGAGDLLGKVRLNGHFA